MFLFTTQRDDGSKFFSNTMQGDGRIKQQSGSKYFMERYKTTMHNLSLCYQMKNYAFVICMRKN